MATVEVVSARGRNSAQPVTESHTHDALADRVFTTSAMSGAVLGALAGAGLGAGADGVVPILVGTLGVLVGSAATAVVGRYALLPLWTTFFGAAPRA